MTNLKRKIVSLSIVVLFAFAATIGATFAWFTIGSAATVDDINLTITTSESLLILMDEGYSLPANNAILLDPSSYSSSLTNEMIEDYYVFSNLRLEPLTTVDGIAIKERGGAAGNKVPNIDEDLTGNYIEFSVWVMSQSVSANIAIGEFAVEGTNTITYKDRVEDTVRLSVYNGTDAFVFGNDKDLLFTFLEGQEGYSSTASENSILPADLEDYEDLYAEYFSTVGLPEVDEMTNDKALADQIAVLAADVPTKLTLRIWIEGWDADADNNLNGAVFDLAFQFIVKNTF